MKRIVTYRLGIAAGILLLYLFIATPVHWWHRHQQGPADSCTTVAGNADKHPGKAFIQANSSLSCSLCSHHYSVYAGTEGFVYQPLAPLFNECRESYQASKGTIPALLFSNKGPPSYLS